MVTSSVLQQRYCLQELISHVGFGFQLFCLNITVGSRSSTSRHPLRGPVVPSITLLFFVCAEKCNIPECQNGWLHADYVRGENPPGREYAREEIITWPCPHHLLDVMMSGFGRICGDKKRIRDIYVTAALENLRHYRLHCDAVLYCWLSFLFMCCCSVFC